MRGLVDLTGNRYGRLVVIERAPNVMYGECQAQTMWRCRCDCGAELIVRGESLKCGGTRSCGCFRAEKAKRRLQLAHELMRKAAENGEL